MAEEKKEEMIFRYLLRYMIQRRWFITALVLGSFVLIIAGIFVALSSNISASAEWKELLLLLLGAFIGSYGKIIDFWFSDQDRDKMLSQKADEEDGVTLSHTNDMKETNKPFAPLMPDAFVQGAAGARELAKEENKHTQEMEKIKNQQEYIMAKDQQEHEQEMEKLEFEYQSHRQCMHEWGDADNDGELECQKCGLLKDQFDESH
jgi:phosphoglycerol transferase MdoB-like AlkP superfamily enzyme